LYSCGFRENDERSTVVFRLNRIAITTALACLPFAAHAADYRCGIFASGATETPAASAGEYRAAGRLLAQGRQLYDKQIPKR
jgi:hypothetical protein